MFLLLQGLQGPPGETGERGSTGGQVKFFATYCNYLLLTVNRFS